MFYKKGDYNKKIFQYHYREYIVSDTTKNILHLESWPRENFMESWDFSKHQHKIGKSLTPQ